MLTAVEAGIQAWADAYNVHDPDAVAARYHPDAVFWGTVSPTLRATPAEIRDYFTSLSDRPMAQVEIEEHRVQLFGDLALAAGFYTFTDVTNGETVTRPSRFSFALRLTDNNGCSRSITLREFPNSHPARTTRIKPELHESCSRTTP